MPILPKVVEVGFGVRDALNSVLLVEIRINVLVVLQGPSLNQDLALFHQTSYYRE